MSNYSVDPDIAALSLQELQQQYMERRNEAREAMRTIHGQGNDNCWDGLIKTCEQLLPEHEQQLYTRGSFRMTAATTLQFCKLWIADQIKHGNIIKPEAEETKEGVI